jgi:hypothetical protein
LIVVFALTYFGEFGFAITYLITGFFGLAIFDKAGEDSKYY